MPRNILSGKTRKIDAREKLMIYSNWYSEIFTTDQNNYSNICLHCLQIQYGEYKLTVPKWLCWATWLTWWHSYHRRSNLRVPRFQSWCWECSAGAAYSTLLVFSSPHWDMNTCCRLCQMKIQPLCYDLEHQNLKVFPEMIIHILN